MAFNMVANRVNDKISYSDLVKSLVKLQLTENKKQTKNLVEWDEAMREVFSTHGLIQFVSSEYYNIQLPSNMVARTMLQVGVGQILDDRARETKRVASVARLSSRAAAAGNPGSPQQTPRRTRSQTAAAEAAQAAAPQGEEAEEKQDADQQAAAMPAPTPLQQAGNAPGNAPNAVMHDSVPVVSTPAHIPIDNLSQSRYEQILLERANEIMKSQLDDEKAAEKRLVRGVTYYMNPITALDYADRGLNTRCEYEIEFPRDSGVKRFYELEKAETKQQRHLAWRLLLASLSNLHAGTWRHIPMGNVFALYQLIIGQYMDKNRGEIAEELTDRMQKLEKKKNELYASFCGRVEQLKTEMNEIGMSMDKGYLTRAVVNAHTRSKDEKCKELFRSVMIQIRIQHGERFDADTILSLMKPTMESFEREANKEDREDHDDQKRRAKEKKLRARARKAAAKAATVRVNAARADLPNLPAHLKGLCLAYQDDACKFSDDECRYNHKTVSKSDLKAAKDYIKAKKELNKLYRGKAAEGAKAKDGPECYSCGKKGHIAVKCPKNATTAKANVSKAARSEMSTTEVMNMAKGVIADDQVERFASAIYAMHAKARSQSE